MVQEIITYIILAISFGLTFYKTLGFFNLFNGMKSTNKPGCASGSCSSCSFKHLHTAMAPIDTSNITELRIR